MQCFPPLHHEGKDSLIILFIIYSEVFDGINNAAR